LSLIIGKKAIIGSEIAIDKKSVAQRQFLQELVDTASLFESLRAAKNPFVTA